MKVFLLKSVPQVGIAGEVIKVADGYAKNFLFPKKLAVEINATNEQFYKQREKQIEHRKEVIATETSMLSQEISQIKLVLKRKTHDDGKLYASVNPADVVDLLAAKGIKVGKSQIIFDKAIKTTGTYQVTVKLSSKLQPQVTLQVSA
ncbi:50S ribosomal protein L9 [bacterium]|jgi:large subunit ribosomal protein L9|nr:50S ribosomal protein L9 [bacterium]